MHKIINIHSSDGHIIKIHLDHYTYPSITPQQDPTGYDSNWLRMKYEINGTEVRLLTLDDSVLTWELKEVADWLTKQASQPENSRFVFLDNAISLTHFCNAGQWLILLELYLPDEDRKQFIHRFFPVVARKEVLLDWAGTFIEWNRRFPVRNEANLNPREYNGGICR